MWSAVDSTDFREKKKTTQTTSIVLNIKTPEHPNLLGLSTCGVMSKDQMLQNSRHRASKLLYSCR